MQKLVLLKEIIYTMKKAAREKLKILYRKVIFICFMILSH